MKSRFISMLLLFTALAVFGCEGPEGPRGPAGPEGSANVIYSEWYSPETWVAQTTYGVAERAFTMETTALTQDIIDYGVVMVYMRFLGFDPAISQLPVILGDVDYSFLFRPEAGSIEVAYYSIGNPATDPGVIPSNNQVRYVLIPGGVIDEAALSEGVGSARLVESLASMPYGEACGLFGIPE